MNNQHPRAGVADYGTDPLFGALPDGYDGRQHDGRQQYADDQAPAHPYADDQAPAYPYTPDPYAQQYGLPYAYGYATVTGGGWDGQHAYAYDAAAGATAVLPHQAQGQDPQPRTQPQAYGGYAEHPGYEPTVQWTVPDQALADPVAGHPDAHPGPHAHQEHEPAPAPAPYDAGWYASQDTLVAPLVPPAPEPVEPADPESAAAMGPEPAVAADAEPTAPDADAPWAPSVPRPGGRSAARAAGARSRRRAPAKRSALLTIAVPSACVMGAAGIAAASVTAAGGGDDKRDDLATTAVADPSSVQPVAANDRMDTQLAALSADARDFGDRASRTQKRIDLKARQAAEKKKREEEAARKEAARPKYLLPVKQRGLSAYFGQAGVNWMSVHTGIDFPVMTGTPVMAATDGTVRTQWNSSYGNMVIVTAPDGTETWYCHLSSARVRSGSVKAGDAIAYSGNTGNTTGPHLHFEVRPGGGAAIDPLPWLRGHGLDPT
ncbi:M23 family metallopeptidase [Streptomyces tremellae]|uniref:M23ase beta-sheet core domain-containing protein n=1 Tax=Streptomyces tremellae TaxID=1124239 RepID=A0ABP7GFX8_9ACTN